MPVQAPIADLSAISNLDTPEDDPWVQSLANYFHDPDGDPLTYTMNLVGGAVLPSWLSFNSITGDINGVPLLPTSLAIEVTASDGTLSATQSFNLNVYPLNDPPVVANPVPDVHLVEDQSSFSFQFPLDVFSDEEGDYLDVSLGSDYPSWITWFSPADLYFSGDIPSNYFGDFYISFMAMDISSGSFVSTYHSVHFVVAPVNDRPTLAPSAHEMPALNEDAINNPGQSVAEILAGNAADIETASVGLAMAGMTEAGGVWQYSLDNGTTWTAVGDVSSSGALLLAADNRIRFLPDGSGASADQFTFYAWDMSTGTVGGHQAITSVADGSFSEGAYKASISVVLSNGVNDAPVLVPINPVLAPITNGGAVVTKTVADIVGTSVFDIDTGAATPGIAVSRVQGSGIWQFSHDGGSTWALLSGLSDANAVLLVATDLIRFTPSSGLGGPASIGYYAWDQSTGTEGAHVNVSVRGTTTAFSLERDFASISGNDTLNGTDGSDTLIGLSGNDTLNGFDANDMLYGGSGHDSLDGGLDSDRLFGGTGNDTLLGGDQNDVLDGGSGNNLLHGGLGGDVLSVSGNGLNTITGDDGNDVVTGGAGNDLLDGGAGDDSLTGGVGDDSLTAGAGVDLVMGGDGNDVLSGGDQNDVLTGGDGKDVMDGGSGDDTLTGGAGDDVITGSGGADQIDAGSGNNAIYGGINAYAEDGNDTIVGAVTAYAANGENVIGGAVNAYGGDGNDLIYDSGSEGLIDPGVGNDFVSVFLNSGLPASIDGGVGNDTLVAQHQSATDTTGIVGFETIVADTLTLADETAVADSWLVVKGLNFATEAILNAPAGYLSYGDVELAYLNGSAETDAHLRVYGSNTGAANLVGGQQSDEIYAGNFGNALDGQNGNDVMLSGLGNDTFIGGDGDDTMFGGDGNDQFVEGHGNDSIDGGAGIDTVIYAGNSADYALVESSYLTLTVTGPDGTDTLLSVRNVQFADQTFTFIPTGILLIGGEDPDALDGGVGPDRIDGAGGDDTLLGLDGSDFLLGGTGNDSLDGGIGNDSIEGGTGNDSVLGGTGSDFIETADGNDTVDAGAGNDLIVGGNGAGDDRYTGGTGVDTVRYTSAVTGITVDLAATTAVGNEIGSDRLFGIEGIIGGQAGDSISGNAQANWIDGYTGADTLTGRGGDDTYLVDRASDLVVEVAGEGTDTVITSITGLVLAANAEDLVLAGPAIKGTGNAADNHVTGNAVSSALFGADGNDTLIGDLGNDTLDGGTGNDNLNGGAGADVLKGGSGNDKYAVDDAGDVVTEAAGVGTDTVFAALAVYALSANVENLVGTGTVGAALTGNGLANIMTGTGFDDRLDGGAGADTLRAGLGDDIYTVDVAGDVVAEAGTAGIDTVAVKLTSYTLGSNLEALVGLNTKASTLIGNRLANTITGNVGNDSLDGGAGKDTMAGGLGNDTYAVDSAGDVVTEAAGGGTDTVQTTSANFTLAAEVEKLVALGAGPFNGTGNSLANTITGNIGNDKIAGLDGNDTLTGGLGDDVFVFNAALSATNRDTVTDFNSGNDTIRLENTGAGLFNALPVGALDPSAFKLIGPWGSTVDADDRILYRQSTGQLFYDPDGGSAVLFATLIGSPAIDQTDFVIT